jgi:hypothetical protein
MAKRSKKKVLKVTNNNTNSHDTPSTTNNNTNSFDYSSSVNSSSSQIPPPTTVISSGTGENHDAFLEIGKLFKQKLL